MAVHMPVSLCKITVLLSVSRIETESVMHPSSVCQLYIVSSLHTANSRKNVVRMILASFPLGKLEGGGRGIKAVRPVYPPTRPFPYTAPRILLYYPK